MKIKRFAILLSAIFFSNAVIAQFEFGASNTNNLVLGSNATLQQNAFSIFENLANIDDNKSFQFGLAAKNSFLIPDLNTYFLAFAFNTSKEKIALGIAYNGFDAFNESIVKLGYARKIGDNLNIGSSFNALRLSTFNYEDNFYLNFDFGLQVKVDDKLTIGGLIENPIPYKTESAFTNLNYGVINFGLTYALNDKFLFAVEANKPVEKQLNANVGLQYKVAKQLALLVGFSSNPQTLNFGLNFNLGNTKIGTASVYHQSLSFAPTFDFSFIKDLKTKNNTNLNKKETVE